MTIITPQRPILYPDGICPNSTAVSLGNAATLDAAGEYVATIIQAPFDMTISHVGFRTNAVTGSPTGAVTIESLDSTGFPVGTLWSANTSLTPTATLTSGWNLNALTASASIPRGSFFAVKVAYNSGTNFQMSTLGNWVFAGAGGYAVRIINIGTPTKGTPAATVLSFALGSSSTAFYNVPGLVPASAVTSTDFNSGSGTVRYGIKFRLPFVARIVGGSFVALTTGDFTFALHNDAGTLMESIAIDGNMTEGGCNTYIFDTPQSLAKDTWYRMTIEATTGTNQEVQTITVPSTDYLTAQPWGIHGHLTTWNGSAWDDTNTTIVPVMQVLLDQVDDGTGVGASAATTGYTFS